MGEEKKSEVTEETAIYPSDPYLACSFLLSMAEQRAYIDNTKSFPTLLCFRRRSYNIRVLAPFTPSILIHPQLCSLIISGHEWESLYIVYKPGMPVPPL